jgi:VanZ family protein
MAPRFYRPLLPIVCVLILWRALGPYSIPEFMPNMDKWVHAVVFCGLLALLDRAFVGKLRYHIMVVLTFGLLIELLQMGTQRTASLFDWLADLAGVLSYLLLLYGYRHWEKRR